MLKLNNAINHNKEFIPIYRIFNTLCFKLNFCRYVDRIKIYEKILKISTLKLITHVNHVSKKRLSKDNSIYYIDYYDLCDRLYVNDIETKRHCLRMCKISLDFSKHMGFSIKETNELLLCICYHDIGKLIVPSSVLFSTCKLSDQEWRLIKNHVNFINMDKLRLEKDIIHSISQHHENVNGSGYPYNLKEDEINEKAKIVALIDVYEALTSKRSYKNAHNKQLAIKIIQEDIGIKFSKKHAHDFINFLLLKE